MEAASISDRVLIALRQIIRAIDLHSRRLVTEHGLTGPQLIVLRALERLDESPVGKLAQEVSLSHATVTGVLDRLEKQGLVQRRRGEEDRRRVLTSITGKGRETLAVAPPLLQEEFISDFVELRDWEQTLILSSLQRVADMMRAKDVEAELILVSEPLTAATHEALDMISKGVPGHSGGDKNKQS